MKKAIIVFGLLLFGFKPPETHKRLQASTVANMQQYIQEVQKYLSEKPFKEVAGLINDGSFVNQQIEADLKDSANHR